METTVQIQVCDRVMQLCDELAANGTFRAVTEKLDVLALEKVFPSLQVVFLDEENLLQEEDNRGYEFRMGVLFKVSIREQRDPYRVARQLAADVQAKIEGDLQLNNLANRIVYQGSAPFSAEIEKPWGGVILSYDIFYRRYRALPDRSY